MRFAIVSIVIVALAVAAAQPVVSGQLTNARTPRIAGTVTSLLSPISSGRGDYHPDSEAW